MSIYHFIFVAVALFSVYIQTKSYAIEHSQTLLAGGFPAEQAEYERLLRVRRFLSPAIAGLAALFVAIGAFYYRNPDPFLGVLLTGVWVFAAVGDIFVEGSYSTMNESLKARYYIIGMLLFIIFTLGLGVGLVAYALSVAGTTTGQVVFAVVVALLMGILAYRTLDVSPDNLMIVLVYTVSVTILLCGGILAALNLSAHLAYIGIAYFFSDWLVGLRDFGKNIPEILKKNILILILILYYTIMLTSIDYVL
jgi:hypothetical protein